jgi:5-formyltetrahydrofolate cyclo-ligase
MTMAREEIIAWRKGERARLIAARVAVPDAAREAWTQRIIASLEPIVMAEEGPVSFFWPFRGEPNLRPLMRRMVAAGKVVALPVVVQQRHPLEFRPWTPGCTMELGVWNIPIPDTRERVTPRLLVAPVVGFDPERYRLGYGGGFYDRTLAALQSPRTVIGVGFDSQAVAAIHPLPHDIKMDRIITESGIRHSDETPELSSPACLLAEAPDSYAGYLNETEIATELRALRATSDLADLAVMRALDELLERLPAQAVPQDAARRDDVPVSERLAQLRARVRDDALHAALGEVLHMVQQAERT